jgi:hypothetical protein
MLEPKHGATAPADAGPAADAVPGGAWLEEARTLTERLAELATAQADRVETLEAAESAAAQEGAALRSEMDELRAVIEERTLLLTTDVAGSASPRAEAYRANKALVEEQDRRLLLEMEVRALHAKLASLGEMVSAQRQQHEQRLSDRDAQIDGTATAALELLGRAMNLGVRESVAEQRGLPGQMPADTPAEQRTQPVI